MTKEEFFNSIDYHKPNEDQIERISKIRKIMKEHYEMIDKLVAESRCKSIARTKLEESGMWFVKGIVLEEND